MDDAPNARVVVGDEVTYHRIGDNLKVRYKAEKKGRWLEFNPSGLSVELNGQPITLCHSLHIDIEANGVPYATLGFSLESIDIDADTMIALQAIVDTQKAIANGETT